MTKFKFTQSESERRYLKKLAVKGTFCCCDLLFKQEYRKPSFSLDVLLNS